MGRKRPDRAPFLFCRGKLRVAGNYHRGYKEKSTVVTENVRAKMRGLRSFTQRRLRMTEKEKPRKAA
jgi:hypothetical protein